MEVIDDIKGMMHLLMSGHFESNETLFKILTDVYQNFTSIHKAFIALFDDLNVSFYDETYKKNIGLLITFCRCSLMRILEEDMITINPSLADLLVEIELHLLDLVKAKKSLRALFMFYERREMMDRICKAYFEPLSIQLVLSSDLIIEFLDQCLKDIYVAKGVETLLKENFTVLRNYIELLTSVPIHCDNLQILFVAVQNVAYKMTFHALFLKMDQIYLKDFDRGYISLEIQVGIIEAMVFRLDGSSSGPLMSDELLTGYGKCIRNSILWLLNTFDGLDTLKGQLMILHDVLAFVIHLLITYLHKHNSKQEKSSNIRSDIQALAKNVGSVICSCVHTRSLNLEEMSLVLLELIENANAINSEIINIICCMVLQETEQESPETDQLGSLILLLQDLKEFMDSKHGMSVTWKDHENLVLFIFYLIRNNTRGGNHIGGDEFSRNHDELEGVLVSAKVVAFNMACCSLLKKYGNLRWWELYFLTEERADWDIRVRILEEIVLSSTTALADELLIAYAECMRDSLQVAIQRDGAADDLKDQFIILHGGILFLVHFLLSYRHETEKVSQVKIGFQDFVRSVGSVICQNLNKRVEFCILELSNLVTKMNLVLVETEELLHLVHINKIGRESPKINQLSSLNVHLENWKGLMECESELIITWKDQFQLIHENLVLFKSFLTSCNGDEESQAICSSILDAGHVAEYLLTTYSVGTCPSRCRDLWILEFTKHVELIKATIMKVDEEKGNTKDISIAGKDRSQLSTQALLESPSTDVVVGLEVEMELIRKQLAGHLKQLNVISIVGMPGLGKTTLARKVYEDSFTINYFDARAWCRVSQEYNKKDLLLAILDSITELTDKMKGGSESDLSVMVHKQLMGRRYLIVLDDIWDINVFMYLKRFFPDDNKGSRIMLTSRSKVIGSQAQCEGELIEPHMLTDEQSWNLLERKVYNKGRCPSELCQTGKEIAKNCRGLPLAVVVIGGVLATSTHERDLWEQVRGSLNSYLAHDSRSQVMAALELSYEFLPSCLKPMFLYLGAFPEDKEIHVVNLLQLWSAEGFVQNTESENLESQAEINLMDLIDRSLVMVAKRRSDGRVKACLVHDLLRDMCLAKAEEVKFMQQVRVHNELPYPVMYRQRLSIFLERDDETTSMHFLSYKDLPKFSIAPPIYSLLFFHVGPDEFHSQDVGAIISSLKLLKVFDAQIFEITQDVLDEAIPMLVHLRYMRFQGYRVKYIPSSISQLRSLETLIINKSRYSGLINVPETIWEMTKLRHLHINPAANFSAATENLFLENLQTLSTPLISFDQEEKLFRKVPGLKKLSCYFHSCSSSCSYDCQCSYDCLLLNFESLGKLESLAVSYSNKARFLGQLKLPLTLKKLNIKKSRMEWSQISMLQTLPNLEVLILNSESFEGKCWDMGEDDVFTNLKLLKLIDLDLKIWNAFSGNFPRLEKLVLRLLSYLEEIPSDLGELDTLREIDVIRCYCPAVNLVKEIEKEQEEFGNESLKFYFYQNDVCK